MASIFTASVRPRFRALAVSFVPETALATEGQWGELETAVDQAVSARPAALRRQLALLIRAIDVTALLRFGRGVTRLRPEQRSVLLEAMATSRLLLLRRGIWGLRTLVMLGWYTQPSVTTALGYRASAGGWSDR